MIWDSDSLSLLTQRGRSARLDLTGIVDTLTVSGGRRENKNNLNILNWPFLNSKHLESYANNQFLKLPPHIVKLCWCWSLPTAEHSSDESRLTASSPDLHSLVIRRLQPTLGWLKHRLEGVGGWWRVLEGGANLRISWLPMYFTSTLTGLSWWMLACAELARQMVSGHSGLATLHAVWY